MGKCQADDSAGVSSNKNRWRRWVAVAVLMVVAFRWSPASSGYKDGGSRPNEVDRSCCCEPSPTKNLLPMVQCEMDSRLRLLFHFQHAYFSLNHSRKASIALEGCSIFLLACLQGSVVGFAVDSCRLMVIYVLDGPKVPIVQMKPPWNLAVLEVNATKRLASLPPLPEVHFWATFVWGAALASLQERELELKKNIRKAKMVCQPWLFHSFRNFNTEVIEVRSLILLFFDCRMSRAYTSVEWGNWRRVQLRKRRPADQKPWRFAARGGRWQEAVGRINGFSVAFDGVFVFYTHVWGIWFGIPCSFFSCLGRSCLYPWVYDIPWIVVFGGHWIAPKLCHPGGGAEPPGFSCWFQV